jgi:hypothetical protein
LSQDHDIGFSILTAGLKDENQQKAAIIELLAEALNKTLELAATASLTSI